MGPIRISIVVILSVYIWRLERVSTWNARGEEVESRSKSILRNPEPVRTRYIYRCKTIGGLAVRVTEGSYCME
jgi:hypothetical protein